MSEIIAKVLERYGEGETEGILLLDEFNCMSDTILPVMLSFLQTKNIGMHTLPEGWVIVLCGNQGTYNRSARNFDCAIWDRMRKLTIEFESEDFLEYANLHHFEKEIQDFLRINPGNIYLCTKGKEENLVTSRGWENLDITMKMMREVGEDIDEKLVRQFIKSERISKEFYKYYLMQKSEEFNFQDCEKILKGKDLEHYAKIIRDMKFYTRVDALETLVKLLCDKAKNGVKAEIAKNYISRVIKLYTLVEDDSCLEMLYNRINEDKVLIKILSTYECKEYVKLVQNIYYGKCAV